ncbi:Na+/H+ antiporter NhaC [Priestia flexa]|uniref:Na+/H+ antiporter NhaC n=1 Tax=Priestia flexa TaxID=86664 RepID=UPI001B3359EA|nr:Na+/H+ antiporter NhaC [Priestia flexa]
MKKEITFGQSIGIVIVLLGLIFASLFLLGLAPHVPLLISIVALCIIGALMGVKWKTFEHGIVEGIKVGIKPILILMLVGVLIAAWMVGGTIPTILSYGFNWISPQYFLISALLITILVSSFTGSTFTTISTVGVALFGIGTAIGVNPGLAAGIIVSGAVFGDKMSPLSDTTNFASGIVGVPLTTHIRHMLWTTLPSIIVTAGIALVIGISTHRTGVNYGDIEAVQNALGDTFNLNLLTLLSPLVVLILSIKRFDVLPTLVIGVIIAVITGVLLQPTVTLGSMLGALQSGGQIDSGNEIVNAIVTKGGLDSMMFSVSLVIIALALGGLMRELGVVQALIEGLAKQVRRSGDVVLSTILSSIGVNVITGEQYLSILLPGQTFKPLYVKWNLKEKNLSRTLEDGGTVINPLIPWGVSGAFISQTLGVPVVEYLPFAFFCLLCPIFAVILGYTGIGIAKQK